MHVRPKTCCDYSLLLLFIFFFLQSLAEGPENVVGLCTFKDFSAKFVSTQPIPTKLCLPSSLQTLYRDTHEKLDRAHLMAKSWVHKQTGVTEQQRKCAEMVTRSQSACPVWHEDRVGRIAASTAHAALRARDTPQKSLLTRICKPSTTPINTPAIVWGRQHEDEVFRVYTDIVTGNSAPHDWSHVACTTSKAGLHIGGSEPVFDTGLTFSYGMVHRYSRTGTALDIYCHGGQKKRPYFSIMRIFPEIEVHKAYCTRNFSSNKILI